MIVTFFFYFSILFSIGRAEHFRIQTPAAALRRNLATNGRSFNYSASYKRDDPNGHTLDNFGKSVAIKNGVALVGSPEDDDNVVALDSGRVFVFRETEDKDWELIREIEDSEPGDYFGWAVALSPQNLAVVGACRDDHFGEFSGGAYYFKVESNPYAQQMEPQRIYQSEKHTGAFFGFSVAITSVNNVVYAAIGAYGHRGKGAVFLYTQQSDGSLGDEHIIYGSDAVYGDKFGWSIAMYGSVLATGAPVDDNQGSVYVYRYNQGYWREETKLMQTYSGDDDNNPLYGDFYGMAVAVEQDFVAVGSPHNDVRAEDAGAVFIYKYGSVSIPTRSLTELIEDYLPESVSDTLKETFGLSSQRRLDYVFSQTLFAHNAQSKHRFGWTLSFDPIYRRLAIGTDCSKIGGTGNAYVYTLSSSSFFDLEAILSPVQNADDDEGEERDSNFGDSVDIYGDYLAVGADKGFGHVLQSGDVYFFRARTLQESKQSPDSGNNDNDNNNSNNGNNNGNQNVSETSSSVGIYAAAVAIVLAIAGFAVYKFGGIDTDYISGSWNSMSGSGSGSTHSQSSLGFLEEDDSQHSTHPILSENKLKSSSNDRKSSSGGSKSSGSGSGHGGSKSSSYPAKSSKSRVQLQSMGTTSARKQGYTATPTDAL